MSGCMITSRARILCFLKISKNVDFSPWGNQQYDLFKKLHFLSKFLSTVQWNTKKEYLPHASPKPLWLWQPLIPQDYVIWSPIRPSNYFRSGRTCCTFQVIRKRPHKIAAFKKNGFFREISYFQKINPFCYFSRNF